MAFPSCSALVATVTMNPTVDVAAQTQSVRHTHKLRTFGEREDPGGGGINVAKVTRALGGRALALALAGGSTGRLLAELLEHDGVPFRPIPIGGRTRIGLSVTDAGTGDEYRFVAQGPTVADAEWQAVLDAVRGLEPNSDSPPWLVASGSLPPGVPADFYALLGGVARQRGMPFVIDSSGPALVCALEGLQEAGGITLLKSSLTELETIAGRALPEREDQEAAAEAVVRSGQARMVALTLGEKGARLTTETARYFLPALNVVENGTTGAGDSFLAGMVMALASGLTPENAFAWGVATGAASVTVPGTARPERATVERLRALVRGPAPAATRLGA